MQDQSRKYTESPHTRQVFDTFYSLLAAAENNHDNCDDSNRYSPKNLLPVGRLPVIARAPFFVHTWEIVVDMVSAVVEKAAIIVIMTSGMMITLRGIFLSSSQSPDTAMPF